MGNNIRPFEPKDWNEVKAIYQQGIDTNIATFEGVCPRFEEWDTSHLKVCRFVHVLEGAVVGWVALSPVSSRCVYAGVAELSIYIAENSRGKGIGTALINAAIEESEINGIWTLQSGIMQDNTVSIRLHKKCGFREVGFREKIARDRFGTWRNTILMERRSGLDNFC